MTTIWAKSKQNSTYVVETYADVWKKRTKEETSENNDVSLVNRIVGRPSH